MAPIEDINPEYVKRHAILDTSKEEMLPTEGKINEINEKLDRLTKMLSLILKSSREKKNESEHVPASETELLNGLATIEEKIAYLLNNIVL